MKYFVTIKDEYGKKVDMEVSAEIFEVFEDEKKLKERQRNEARRHYDKRGVEDYIIAYESPKTLKSTEEIYIDRETIAEILAVYAYAEKAFLPEQNIWLQLCGNSKAGGLHKKCRCEISCGSHEENSKEKIIFAIWVSNGTLSDLYSEGQNFQCPPNFENRISSIQGFLSKWL